MKNENNISLAKKLYEYINDGDSRGKLNIKSIEVKPEEFRQTKRFASQYADSPLEVVEKDKNSILTNENKIICDNILMKFFDLDDDKFFACLDKTIEWGFDICFKEFILNYYIRIIKDNRLRQYVILNIESILMMLKERLEGNLLNSIKRFNFTTTDDDQNIELIKNEIIGKELDLLGVKAKNFNEYEPVDEPVKEKLDPGRKKNARIAILNRLKYENPHLLD